METLIKIGVSLTLGVIMSIKTYSIKGRLTFWASIFGILLILVSMLMENWGPWFLMVLGGTAISLLASFIDVANLIVEQERIRTERMKRRRPIGLLEKLGPDDDPTFQKYSQEARKTPFF
jgi:hypothetical protein